MARLTNAQLTDLVAQLERNAEDDRRRIGVMMYEANVQAQRIVELEAEVESLEVDLSIAQSDLEDQSKTADEYDAELTTAKEVIEVQAERIKLLSRKVAAQPKSAPKLTVSAAVVESAPVIQIGDADKRVWSKFQALPREQKQAYYNFAHSNGFGHLGIHNVNAVRVAFLASKAA